ncbi:LCP family protein required for cell wall assembly [Arthrobacter sp. PvP102]|uniref:LCP family protein n=1 Tax=unclassified Arthrobacter TaxID=235627 RepID=UPI00005279D8|nr:cell envelope-related transcriptional attenuator [Arthrobacter sp. FB24]MBP1231523.1 LCP family protein required for cell wall assembly [Arthrobacter sp. PvP103]MBP1236658.1 LCP family protein required for cell wall assembly [Arthrobacter sp. PvP102]
MVRRRDTPGQGIGSPASDAAARHSDTKDMGPARHLGAMGGKPAWFKVATAVVALVLVGALAFAAFWVIRLQMNISKAPLGAGSSRTEDPVNDSKDRMQILILGSDTRDGKNSDYGTAEDSTGYGQSDVMMMMDISADNKRVSVISFPRDLLVDIPECTDQKTKQVFPARSGVMINEAMKEAGIGCAVDTVNKITGLEIDHFMMADFNAVKELSNAVGGVEVCVSDAVYDPDSRLRLPAGNSQVQGEQALAYLRTRHAFADGGDLGRIKAQQGFLSSLTRKIKDDGTLSDPQKMLKIADVVTQNLTVDDGLASVPSLLTIGNRLKNIDISKVAFVAVPTTPAPTDPNRLTVAEPAASQLFAALRKDVDLTDPTATPSPTAEPSESAPAPTPTETPLPPYDKALQPVTVANGTGVPARTQEITQAIIAGGFTQVAPLVAQPVAKTAVYYGPGFEDVAADVAALLEIPATQVLPAAGVSGVQVYLGTDFMSGTKMDSVPLPSDIVNQTAGDTVCQQANPELIVR